MLLIPLPLTLLRFLTFIFKNWGLDLGPCACQASPLLLNYMSSTNFPFSFCSLSFFEAGFHYRDQAGLELSILSQLSKG